MENTLLTNFLDAFCMEETVHQNTLNYTNICVNKIYIIKCVLLVKVFFSVITKTLTLASRTVYELFNY